jgi:pyruvate dehydrogenase E2 component (dihydrolipoamide acetyltransferase)
MSFDATDIMNFRRKVKEGGEALGLSNITLNDIIMFAVSRVLKNHRELNAHFLEDKMRYFEDVNLGMAVDTPRGLLVPLYSERTKCRSTDIPIGKGACESGAGRQHKSG